MKKISIVMFLIFILLLTACSNKEEVVDYLEKLMEKYNLEFAEEGIEYGDYKIKRKVSNDK